MREQLARQMQELKAKECEQNRLKNLERQFLENEERLNQEDLRQKQKAMQKRQKEHRNMLFRQYRAQLLRRAHEIEEDLEQDLALLERIKHEEAAEIKLKDEKVREAQLCAQVRLFTPAHFGSALFIQKCGSRMLRLGSKSDHRSNGSSGSDRIAAIEIERRKRGTGGNRNAV